jgi:hypothetical protein
MDSTDGGSLSVQWNDRHNDVQLHFPPGEGGVATAWLMVLLLLLDYSGYYCSAGRVSLLSLGLSLGMLRSISSFLCSLSFP